ncbi:MAG: hypothetical protein HZB46_02910 [Solirubrobacterales bacterium]|nr:hypothetical protein [Solirubrobacterales bacterium]
MSTRTLAVLSALVLLAGIVLLVADVVPVVGYAMLGIGGVLLVSLAFYAIGVSEDRDRARHPHG